MSYSQNLILDKIKYVSILLVEARSQITSIVFRCQYPVWVFWSETLTKPFAQSRSTPSIWYWIFISFLSTTHKHNNRRVTVVTRRSDMYGADQKNWTFLKKNFKPELRGTWKNKQKSENPALMAPAQLWFNRNIRKKTK